MQHTSSRMPTHASVARATGACRLTSSAVYCKLSHRSGAARGHASRQSAASQPGSHGASCKPSGKLPPPQMRRRRAAHTPARHLRSKVQLGSL